MTAFVILAAGRGTRMGRVGTLHKALLPLGGRAVISRQIALAPPDARVIVCTGYRGWLIRDYLELAHPELKVTFVPVPGWDKPGGGPGASLLRRPWTRPVMTTWSSPPATRYGRQPTRCCGARGCPGRGSRRSRRVLPPESWRRISVTESGLAQAITTRARIARRGVTEAYTGLSMIARRDLPAFRDGIASSSLSGGERHYWPALAALTRDQAAGGAVRHVDRHRR